MPHNVATDVSLHCLLTGVSIKNSIKATNRLDTPKMTNGVIQHITMEESTSRQWVNLYLYKYVYEVLVNCLGGLSLPRKSVVRLTDRPDMTLDVYRGRKTTIQYNTIYLYSFRGNNCVIFVCAFIIN